MCSCPVCHQCLTPDPKQEKGDHKIAFLAAIGQLELLSPSQANGPGLVDHNPLVPGSAVYEDLTTFVTQVSDEELGSPAITLNA